MTYSILLKKILFEFRRTGIKSATTDAQVLLEFATGKSREFLLANPDWKLSGREVAKLKKTAKQREKYCPLAYIVGKKEFFGLDFDVSPDVLVPRPESEIIVEAGLKYLATVSNQREVSILDVGTGSGNIIISLAKNINRRLGFESIDSNPNLLASDISEKALKIARNNAKKHRVKIKFIKSDLFKNISGRFDLISANLPYLDLKWENLLTSADSKGLAFEPKNALEGGNDGTKIIHDFCSNAPLHLKKKGVILIEIGPDQLQRIIRDAQHIFPKAKISVIKDLSGFNRVIKISS